MLLPAIPAAGEEPIGRLFLTPQQRLNLERIRQGGKPDAKDDETGAEKPADSDVTFSGNVTLDGFVKRNGSKKSTIWINSQPQNEDEHPQGIGGFAVKGNSSRISLKLPSGRNVLLKAGQSIDVTTSQVREGYESGIIVSTITAPAASPRKH